MPYCTSRKQYNSLLLVMLIFQVGWTSWEVHTGIASNTLVIYNLKILNMPYSITREQWNPLLLAMLIMQVTSETL